MSLVVVAVLRVERVRPEAGATCSHCDGAFLPSRHVSLITYVLDGNERSRMLHHRCVGALVRKWLDAGWSVTAKDGTHVPGVTTC